jgi:hypothetical protein
VVSVGEKREDELVQVRIRETNESKPVRRRVVKNQGVVKTRIEFLAWDKSVECLMIGRTATGV